MAKIANMTLSDYQLDEVKSITDFYADIAENILKVDGDYKFNPSKIYVSNNLYSEFEQLYVDQGVDRVGFAMVWLNIGPKTDESLEDNQVRVEDGFIERIERKVV